MNALLGLWLIVALPAPKPDYKVEYLGRSEVLITRFQINSVDEGLDTVRIKGQFYASHPLFDDDRDVTWEMISQLAVIHRLSIRGGSYHCDPDTCLVTWTVS